MHVCVPCILHMCAMGWLRLVGSLKWQVSFAKEPYKGDYIVQKRPVISRSLLIVATPYDIKLEGAETHNVTCILSHVCDMSHPYVCHVSFVCVPWLMHVCAMTNEVGRSGDTQCDMDSHAYVCHDSFVYECHDSFTCAQWQMKLEKAEARNVTRILIYVCAMTRSCVPWLVHVYVMTDEIGGNRDTQHAVAR